MSRSQSSPEPHRRGAANSKRFGGKEGPNPWPDPGIPDGSYGSPEDLYNQVKAFCEDHLELMDEREYHILGCFTLASYRQDDFETAPYLFFLGPPSSGKTRALECLWQLCHLALLVSSISPSALFRSIDLWHPTLLIDETEVYTAEQHAEIRAVLNAGYRRGQMVIRSIKAGKGDDYELGTFDPYCFKALAGTTEMWDTLRSRCILIRMQRANRRVVTMLDKYHAAKLRAMLHHYRLNHDAVNVTADYLADVIPDLRVVELFLPLIAVAPNETVRKTLIEYAEEIAVSRVEDETITLEARVLEAALAASETSLQNGKLTVRDITERLNVGLDLREWVQTDRVGKVLSKLGFRRTRVGHSAAHGIVWDLDHVARLVRRYAPYRVGEKGSGDTKEDTPGEG